MTRAWGIAATCAVVLHSGAPAFAQEAGGAVSAPPVEKLPPGYVRGDVVSYSYVPNRYWGRAEACGMLPYLCEYGVTKWTGDEPLEAYHDENVRRIDLVSQWSTCIMLYARYHEWRDEIINLMIRAFRHRQLIILRDYFEPDTPEPLRNTLAILDKLWAHRDRPLSNPEGDRATGRQVISNILMVKMGDENLAGLKTSGLEAMYRTFDERIKDHLVDGERPFAHIKAWYNDMHYGMGVFACTEEDVAHGRQKLPANAEFIGVDTYHYWSFEHTPFDPADPKVPRQRIIEHAIGWQNVITRYYGPEFRVTWGDRWVPEHRNDTHAMLQALDLAGADRAMMVFIGLSNQIPGKSYTTPVETMDAYYDALKAGPWVGLIWWYFDNSAGPGTGTLDYLDRTLLHYTPEHPEGVPYSQKELAALRRRFIASRKRMFRDVMQGQFGHLS